DAVRDRITREGGVAEAEIRYRHANGSWVHLHVHYRAGRKLASGLYEMYGLSQSITAAAQARDEADANASRLRLALKAARAAVIEYDYASRTLWATPELAAMVDARPLEQAAENPLMLFHPEHREEVAALHRIAASGVHAEPLDVRVERSGGERWMRLYLEVECGDDGEPRRAISLLLDVDDQKRQALALADAQRTAEQATAAKSQFLASVSHEIRTPMNGIVGVLNLLKREPITEGGRELLDEALGSSQMLGQLINDVLDFSKIEAGKLDINPVPVDPTAIAESVAGLVRVEAESKGLYLRTRLEPDIGWLSIDPVRLRQCMFNVLGNAVKFTETGGVELRLSLVGTRRKRRLRCEVEDTGIGIPQAFRGLLFDRFQQVEAGANRRFGGTGLGLAISRNLARMMGGDMDFTSTDGQGSTFWFEIAAVPAQAPSAGLEGQEDEAPLGGLRILVVDDNATNRLVGVKTLEALGAEAEAVDSGEAALQAVQTTAFDLVLMDINMPGMDGMEATQRIRALPARAAGVPILALTANVMTHHLQSYLAAGLNGVVPKPFAPAELLSEIARVLHAGPASQSAAGAA
ncbi:MAG: ATP-binding protein, partial [Phenylobacterium sp.]